MVTNSTVHTMASFALRVTSGLSVYTWTMPTKLYFISDWLSFQMTSFGTSRKAFVLIAWVYLRWARSTHLKIIHQRQFLSTIISYKIRQSRPFEHVLCYCKRQLFFQSFPITIRKSFLFLHRNKTDTSQINTPGSGSKYCHSMFCRKYSCVETRMKLSFLFFGI